MGSSEFKSPTPVSSIAHRLYRHGQLVAAREESGLLAEWIQRLTLNKGQVLAYIGAAMHDETSAYGEPILAIEARRDTGFLMLTRIGQWLQKFGMVKSYLVIPFADPIGWEDEGGPSALVFRMTFGGQDRLNILREVNEMYGIVVELFKAKKLPSLLVANILGAFYAGDDWSNALGWKDPEDKFITFRLPGHDRRMWYALWNKLGYGTLNVRAQTLTFEGADAVRFGQNIHSFGLNTAFDLLDVATF